MKTDTIARWRPEPIPDETNRVCAAVVDSALRVHRALGPGLLEGVYEECLAFELRSRGLDVARQVFVPLMYRGVLLEHPLRMDLVAQDRVVVEMKSVSALTKLDRAQLLTYLRLSRKRVGLLFNFNVLLLKHGIVRVAC